MKQCQGSSARVHHPPNYMLLPLTHSPTTPVVTPWKWPIIRTESHPCWLQRLPTPLNIHKSIINPPVNQSIPAAGSRWVSTQDRTKPPLGIDSPPHELSLLYTTIVSRCPVSQITRFSIKEKYTKTKKCWNTPTDGHRNSGASSASLARKKHVNIQKVRHLIQTSQDSCSCCQGYKNWTVKQGNRRETRR